MIVVVLGVALQLVGYFNAALLRTGKPLTWQASKGYLTSIRHEGARQFISHYNRCKLMESPEFVWGDEIEFGILKSDKATNQIDLSLRAGTETRSSLAKNTRNNYILAPTMREITNLYPSMIHDDANLTLSTDVPSANDCEWQPEYGSWMIEAVPKRPFKSDTLYDLMNAEKSMQLRRKRLHRELAGNEIAPTLTAFPMMGVKSYPHTAHIVNFDDLSTHKSLGNDSPSQSSYVSDALINEHPRFAALTRNIRLRRGSKVDIVVPADTHPDEYECTVHLPTGTTTPVLAAADVASSCTAKSDGALNNTKEEDIHMDAMAFGMGCSCLQVTIQAHNEDESRFLHDQLAIMAPILHALSAATPILKGRLAATDTRWNVISQAVDDRTPAERRPINIKSESIIDERNIVESCRDVEMVGEGVRRLSQSRYSEVPLFIARTEGAAEDAAMAALNDIEVAIDDDIYDILRTEGGVDENLSRHIAHLFVRDPLVIFDDSVPVETGAQSLEHFENIQSTNWRSMRWKTPSLELGLQGAGATGSGGGGGGDTSARAVAMETETIFSSTVASMSPILSSQLQHEQMQELKSKQGQEQGQEQGQIKQPGWRVEFRPLELQLTDFENAAFAVLVVLLARCVLSQGHNWYMPMSYVHENMRRAQLKDAVLTQKFWFRKNSLGAAAPNRPFVVPRLEEIEMVELSLDEIMNGQKSSPNMLDDKAPFGGLLPQVAQFVRTHLLPEQQHAVRNSEISKEIVKAKDKADDHMTSSDLPQTSQRGLSSQLCHYVKLIRDRAAGRLPTTARWLRNQAIRHPDYVRESGTLTPQIANDLLLLCEKIGMGRISCPELNGRISVDNLDTIEEYDLMFPNFSAVTNSGDTGEFPCTTFDAISVSKNCTTSSCMYKCV